MTIRETNEAIRVMRHWAEGGDVEHCTRSGLGSWSKTLDPAWNWCSYKYRIKEEAAWKPWSVRDIQWNALYRSKAQPQFMKLIRVYDERSGMFQFGNDASKCSIQGILDTHEHSVDGGNSWKPCGIKVGGSE